MSLSTEIVYTQIENKSVYYVNNVVRGIEDQLTTGTTTLGSVNREIKYKFNENIALDIKSTDANDTSAGGVGAKTLIVNGLWCDTSDSNRLIERAAIFDLDGTSSASLVSGINSFAVINDMVVDTFGSENTNVGRLDAVAVGTTDLFSTIQIRHSKSNTFSHAVPSSKTMLVKEIHISSMCHTACVLELYEQSLNSGRKTLISKIHLNSNSTHIHQPLNHKVPSHYVFYAMLLPLEPILAEDTNHICCNITSLVA
tara:strand:+ start:1821 stop:2585 length:765 start_codon:yes stop_codon:yes gene_type:complete